MVGDGDQFGFVFHHQHGVSLVAQLQQQLTHALHVVGMQPDGGFIEDVGDVCQRGTQVPDHPGALRLTTR